MEDVILVLNKRNTKYVEDPLRTGQSLATKRVLRESLDQMVSDLGINEVLLSPLQVNKLLLWGQVEVEQSFNEFGALEGLETCRADKITLTEL